MDLKNSRKMIRRIKRIFSVSLVMLCSLLLILENSPVEVYAANYSSADFVKDIVVEGDTKRVYYKFGDPISPLTNIYNQSGTFMYGANGSFTYEIPADFGSYVIMNTMYFGSQFHSNGYSYDGLIDVSDISPGAKITLNLSFRIEYAVSVNPISDFRIRYRPVVACYDKNFKAIDRLLPSWGDYELIDGLTFNGDSNFEYTIPYGTAYIACQTSMELDTDVQPTGINLSIRPDPVEMYVDINMINEQSQTMQQIQQQLGDIGGKLDDTNDKLDEIISGGEAGDQLGEAGDRLDDASHNTSDSIGSVDDFESSMMDNAQDKLDDLDQIQIVTGVGDFSGSLKFVSGYLTDIFDGVEQWSVVITAPMFLGLVMYICSHTGSLTHVVRSAPQRDANIKRKVG